MLTTQLGAQLCRGCWQRHDACRTTMCLHFGLDFTQPIRSIGLYSKSRSHALRSHHLASHANPALFNTPAGAETNTDRWTHLNQICFTVYIVRAFMSGGIDSYSVYAWRAYSIQKYLKLGTHLGRLRGRRRRWRQSCSRTRAPCPRCQFEASAPQPVGHLPSTGEAPARRCRSRTPSMPGLGYSQLMYSRLVAHPRASTQRRKAAVMTSVGRTGPTL